jgi:hypothetical protein
MDDYREEVERLALERTGEPFYNSSIDHAAVIIEKMFRHAAREVCIITKNLNGRVFAQDEVVSEAQAFLSNANHKVRILMEDDASCLSEGHAFVRGLRQHPGGYEMKQIPATLLEAVKYHFTLTDDDSYRFEPDKNKWEAVAAFGDKPNADRLRSAFESIWRVSPDITLPALAG